MIDYTWLLRNGGLLVALIAVGTAVILFLIGQWMKRQERKDISK